METKTILLFCLFSVFQTNALDCKDENNNNMDWFIIYKIPKTKSTQKIIQEGLGYIYLTSEDADSWKLSKLSIADNASFFGNTLQDFYKDRSKLNYIVYNNEPPNQDPKENKGHTKGLVAADSTGGFWLVHSIPHFPQLGNSYSYPETGVKYGQSILCISMNLANINTVGLQLQYNQPDIYLENIVPSMKSSITDLAKAAANETIKNAPWTHVAQIFSKKGIEFVSFAKHKNFDQELYVDFVAPYFKVDLDVETWPNGAGRLRSNCSESYKVYNIKSIDMNVSDVTFPTTKDHSKWAISSTNSVHLWSCIGDINRAEHQMFRGGGTVCFNDDKVYGNFKKLIGSIEECSNSFDYLPEVLNI